MDNTVTKPKTTVQLVTDLHKEVDIIKTNHLAHMEARMDDLAEQLKETRGDLNTRFEKLDERLWVLMGLVTTSLLGIVITMVFG